MAYFMFHNIRASRKRNWIQQSGEGLRGWAGALLLPCPPARVPLPCCCRCWRCCRCRCRCCWRCCCCRCRRC